MLTSLATVIPSLSSLLALGMAVFILSRNPRAWVNRFLAIAHRGHRVASIGQHFLGHQTDQVVVLGEENADGSCGVHGIEIGAAEECAGKVSVNVVPLPAALAKATLPP